MKKKTRAVHPLSILKIDMQYIDKIHVDVISKVYLHKTTKKT